MKKILFLPVLLLSCLPGVAQQEARSSRAYANHLAIPGSFIQSRDDKFLSTGTATSTSFDNVSNQVVIELGLDEDKHLPHTSAVKICATFDVKLTNATLASTVITGKQLDITYDPADLGRYKDKAQLVFPNYYQAKIYNVVITACSPATSCGSCTTACTFPDVYMQAEVSTARTYTMDFTTTFAANNFTHTLNAGNDEFTIAWPFLKGATAYELEYTFIDDYSTILGTPTSSTNLTYDLDHDATRIITPNNFYAIPLTCDRGYIVYRLRPVGTNTLSQRIEGVWYPTTSAGSVSTAVCMSAIVPSFPFGTLTWQSLKTFAESGKTGIGVQFSDAMGLPRQSIARLNSESKSIVQGSLFDFYGRPSVAFLPAPVGGLDFKYRFGLNVFTTGTLSTVFDKVVFDRNNTNSFCSPGSFSVDPSASAGAGKYYSPDNTNKEAFQGYLPDAQGYPFTQVQYTGDGLGRISKQTLPGKLHKLSSNRELKYVYVNPEQVQLDRLFGSEAGRAGHYQRISTTDPNGQVSVQIQDMYGRVVASFLKGINPENLDPLPNQVASTTTLVESYDEESANISNECTRCKEVNKNIQIYTANEDEIYTYIATWDNAFTGNCDPSLCFHCVYDVTLSITDECGEEIFDYDGDHGSPSASDPGYFKSIGRQPPYSGTLSCTQCSSAIVTTVSAASSVTITFPGPGKYKIHKKICVSDAPIPEYTDTYLSTACGVDKCEVFNSVLSKIDFSGCLPQTCADCIASVNAYTQAATAPTSTFNYNGPQDGGLNAASDLSPGASTQTLFISSLTPQQLSKAYEDCSVYCQQNDRCSVYERLMEADFYPGTGQYAATSPTAPTWPLSIFNPTNILSQSPTWSTTLTYLNAAGQADYVKIGGTTYDPYELSQADYIQNFRKSWAKTFLPFHPEMCKKYFYCDLLGDCFDYDETFKEILHSNFACSDGGYWFPVRYGSYSSYKPGGSCTSSTVGIDPITMLSYTSVPAFATAISTFTNAVTQNFRNSGVDIYNYTAAQSNTTIATSSTGYHLGQDPCTADGDWAAFKTYYLAAKQVLYLGLLSSFQATPSAFGASNLTCTPLSTLAVSHFPDPESIINANFPPSGTLTPGSFYTVAVNPPVGTNTAAVSSYTNSLSQFTTMVVPSGTYAANHCSVACSSYTTGWDINLKAACPAYSGTDTPTQTAILNAFTAICMLGCDYNTYLLGASSAPTGIVHTLPSTQTVSTFQQVLSYYLPAGGCSTIVLNGPPPYPVYSGTLSANDLSSCRCDIILEVAHEFTTSGSPPSHEWQLFEQKYGFDLPEYYSLKCACQNAVSGTWASGYSWSAPEIAALVNYTMAITPDLQCSSCLSCTDVATAINGLTLPVSSAYSNLLDKINLVPGNQIFVRNTLNSMFGLHTLQQYIDLYEDCASFTATSTFSNTITRQGGDLFVYLRSLVETQSLANTRTMTLCSDDKFYLSSLYTGTLPIIPGYTFTPTQSSNSLTIIISLSATPIATIELVKPSAYGGTWDDLVKLRNFVAYCPSPQTAGANYRFKAEAEDNASAVITLTGAVTCTAWPVSYLSTGASKVPSLCPPEPLPEKNACAINLINNALTQAQQQYSLQVAAAAAEFKASWKNGCFLSLQESFSRVLNGNDEYSHTLYYYDQAGNLNRTAAPNGTDPGLLSAVIASIAPSTTVFPAYSSSTAVQMNFVNEYHYDSYNNLSEESTVDGGKTVFYYDQVGRLLASQNAKQGALSTNTNVICSYSLYDDLGRIKETGQVHFGSVGSWTNSTASYFEGIVTSTVTPLARQEVTRIYYDRPVTSTLVLAAFTGSVQNNLRNRVAYVTHMATYNSNPAMYDNATYYSYDDQGNVTELVQHNRQLDLFNQGLRNIKYEFEYISGNMLKATYQDNKPDQFIHKYYYDDDNRLKEVFTSKDKINWERDAKYFYYEHGPLARVERADKKTQGTDYLYTIHGWIKAINSDALRATSDAGKDAAAGNKYISSYANVHSWFAGDAAAFSLNYYNTGAIADYKSIKTYTTSDVDPLMSIGTFSASNDFYLDNNSSGAGDGPDLFNGNIGSMCTSIIDKLVTNTVTNNSAFPLLTAYRYDQLQRLTSMKSFRSYSASTLTWNPGSSVHYDDAYRMQLTYDNNGNILSLLRNGPGGSLTSSSYSMDNLSYGYFNSSVYTESMTIQTPLGYNSNRLRCVGDVVSQSNYDSDIDNISCSDYEAIYGVGVGGPFVTQGSWRYAYDPTGNLIYDRGEYIANIDWTVDRKVKRILRDSTAMNAAHVTLPDVEYFYNSQRQRVVKIVKPRDVTSKELTAPQYWTYTYYTHDATGNVMATYRRGASLISGSNYKDKLELMEQPIYGSERLALARPTNTFASWTYTFAACAGSVNCRDIPTAGPTLDHTLAANGYLAERDLGYKDFEMTNHLGNVITTLSDRKIQSGYVPANCIKEYDFQNGVPLDPEMNPNHMALSTSGGSLICTMTSTSFISGVNPLFGTNLSSTTVYQIEFDFDPGNLTSGDGLYAVPFDMEQTTFALYTGSYFWTSGSVPVAGHYSFTYTPSHIGSNYGTYLAFNAGVGSHHFKIDNLKMCPLVGSVISYSADIVSTSDYYPFGQTMPGRTWVGGDDYRYDYNGKESDKEVSSGFQNYGMRVYDKRIGRFFSQDPLFRQYAYKTPYDFAENDVIRAVDLDGKEKNIVIQIRDNTGRVVGMKIVKNNARGILQEQRINPNGPPLVDANGNQYNGQNVVTFDYASNGILTITFSNSLTTLQADVERGYVPGSGSRFTFYREEFYGKKGESNAATTFTDKSGIQHGFTTLTLSAQFQYQQTKTIEKFPNGGKRKELFYVEQTSTIWNTTNSVLRDVIRNNFEMTGAANRGSANNTESTTAPTTINPEYDPNVEEFLIPGCDVFNSNPTPGSGGSTTTSNSGGDE